jgi:2-amino-4-hydroxy-6-hydroxymethyldihydropteridine diphosphokinase
MDKSSLLTSIQRTATVPSPVNLPQPILLAIGSNVGDRVEECEQALHFIASQASDPAQIHTSSLWETDPVGPSETPYLNAVIKATTDLTPIEWLTAIKQYEASRGRDLNAPRWSAREIDIDILMLGHEPLDHPELHLPHKEMTQRLFVLLPLQEVEPGWEDPVHHQGIDHWIRQAPSLSCTKTPYSFEWSPEKLSTDEWLSHEGSSEQPAPPKSVNPNDSTS